MSDTNFTLEQKQAYKCDGCNALISAGAGAGKTQVLSERVLHLLRNSRKDNKVENKLSIKNFLILTFTNLAASEMRERIRKELLQNGLEDEAKEVDNAYITTFDSFSLSVLKKYHYKENLSKNISVMDENALKVYVLDYLDEYLESHYLIDETLQQMVGYLCEKDDRNLRDVIFEVYEKASSSFDTEAFLDNLLSKTEEKYVYQYLDEYESKLDSYFKNIYNEISYSEVEKTRKTIQEICDKYYEKETLDEKHVFAKNIPSFNLKEVEEGIKDKVKNERIKIVGDSNTFGITEMFISVKHYKEQFKVHEIFTKKVVEIVRKLIEAAETYKEQLQCFTFSDIAKKAMGILKNNPDICEELKNSFYTIMIDEYQDTSRLQEEFIKLISKNNIYMVGDVKQSIYRFRKAVPELFIEKFNSYQVYEDNYKEGETKPDRVVSLNDNFRSRPEVVDGINSLFSIIMTEELGGANYAKDHIIKCGRKDAFNMHRYPGQDYSCELFEYDPVKEEPNKEIKLIVEDIKRKVEGKYQITYTKKVDGKFEYFYRDAEYSDFCILLDRGTSFPTYQKIFNEYRVPLFVQNNVDIKDQPVTIFVKNILNLLYCYKEKYYKGNNSERAKFNFYVASILRSFVFNYTDEEIYKWLKNKEYNLFKNSDIEDILLCYNKNKKNGPYAYIEKIIMKLRVYDKLARLGDIQTHEKYLDLFLASIKNLNNQGYTLDDFVNYFEVIIEKGLKIDVQSSSTSFKAVKIMNIFKSKGLQFPVIYCAGLDATFIRPQYKARYLVTEQYGIIWPYETRQRNFLFAIYKEKAIQEEISEKIRLFYVQLTRAEEKIICLAPNKKSYNDLPDTNKLYDLFALYRDAFTRTPVKLESEIEAELENEDCNDETEISDNINQLDNQNESNEENNNEIEIDPSKLLTYEEVNVKDEKISFSRASKGLSFDSSINNLQFGEKLHLYLEMLDFNNPDYSIIEKEKEKIYIKNFIESKFFEGLKHLDCYKEYEFYDRVNFKVGIIDLLLIDKSNKKAYIIDYKLKNIDDEAYKEQLKIYKDFVEKQFSFDVTCYLFSLIDGQEKEMKF